ncbi:hypothetical protein C8Q76DRAFT_620997 [Earliella scabrosa]|nr:hypothetical protein C8Q76DRAFT_620997 [Earliella scabrosa]
MGFTTTVSFAHALKDWAEAHRWAFTTMTRALVLLHGGPDALHLDSGAPQFVLYVVSPNPKRAPHEPSPVNTFRVDTLSLLSGAGPGGGGAENASLLQAWAEAEPGRRAMDASFRADGDPRFAGVVSVIYQLADTGMVVHNQHPVWRARTRTAVDDEGTQTMLRDLLGLCRGGINTGVSMRPLDERGYLPFPGVLTRTRKTWTWLPLFKERSLWTGAAAMFPSSILASGLRPEEIFRRFHSL